MPDRITLSRTKGWRKPEGAVIVSRPSIWGNPWAVGNPGTMDALDCRYPVQVELLPAQAVQLYEAWLAGENLLATAFAPDPRQFTPTGAMALRDHMHARRGLILSRLHELRGHDLCCWCQPGQPCHADVLLRLANGGEG